MRAVLIGLLVAAPSALLPQTSSDTVQLVLILAVLAASLTFMEYSGRYPSVIEFRFAPPVNRLKFAILASTVVLLSLVQRGLEDPFALAVSLTRIGSTMGNLADFPYSPVRLLILAVAGDTSSQMAAQVRVAAGLAYPIAMFGVGIFLAVVHLLGWPARRGGFNVWINLPMFDPTRGGDVIARLEKDAGVNLLLGALLPFFMPALFDVMAPFFLQGPAIGAHGLIWFVSAWAFLPASMVIRGIAMARIGTLIAAKRRRAYALAALEPGNLQKA